MFETKLSLAPNCYRAFRSLGCKDQNKHSFDFNKYIFGTYKHAIRKKCFKFLPLSLEILLNLCLYSIKQETACQFNININ